MALAALLLVATPAFASVSVRRSTGKPKTLDVYITEERLSDAIGAIEIYLPKHVDYFLGEDPVITYRAKDVTPEKALRNLTAIARAELVIAEDRYQVRSKGEPAVTLDVKDADAREILRSMQRQCGIRNLLIDPKVEGTGTFLFNQVPCRQAFDVVLRSLGLAAQTYSDTMVSVGANPH